jgi:tetratricopeptide (TPR) repeat protein
VPDAFAAGDTAEAARLIDLLRRIDPATDHVTGLGLAFDLAFGAPAARATAQAALATASTEVLRDSYFYGDANCCASLPERWEQDLLVARALTANRHPAAARRAAAVELALIYTSRGRFREADSIYAAIPPESAAQRKNLIILSNQVGVTAESSMAHRAVKALGEAAPLYRHYSGAARALREGRRSEADAEILALESIGRLTSGALSAGLRALQAADTDSTIRSFERALGFAAGQIVFQLRYDLGRLSLESGDLERAEEHLASIEMREAHGLNAPIEYYLGKVYERLGNSERARLHYGRFVLWWQDCDPEVRPMWEEARQAVARLQ